MDVLQCTCICYFVDTYLHQHNKICLNHGDNLNLSLNIRLTTKRFLLAIDKFNHNYKWHWCHVNDRHMFLPCNMISLIAWLMIPILPLNISITCIHYILKARTVLIFFSVFCLSIQDRFGSSVVACLWQQLSWSERWTICSFQTRFGC